MPLCQLVSYTSLCCDTARCSNIDFSSKKVSPVICPDLAGSAKQQFAKQISSGPPDLHALTGPTAIPPWPAPIPPISSGRLDDTLESFATLAPERDRPSPSPCPSPPPSPPPVQVLAPQLPPPAVLGPVEDGGGKEEEHAGGGQAAADSVCRVMGLLGMGHRLFVPRLLAVREGFRMVGLVGFIVGERTSQFNFCFLSEEQLVKKIYGEMQRTMFNKKQPVL